MYITPSRKFIDLIHSFVIKKYGGADGVLNEGNIESAIHSPEASFGGQDLYDTDLKKCCKLFHALVSNHGYQDGNKRVGVIIFAWALQQCGISLNQVTNHFMETAALMIASGKLSVERLYEIVNNSLEIDKQN